MPLKFIIKVRPAGKFAFSVVARNGNVIVTSDDYSSRAAAMNGVRSLKSQAADAAIEDQSTKAWLDAEAGRGSATGSRPAARSSARPARRPAAKPKPKRAPAPVPELEPESPPEPEPEFEPVESEVERSEPAAEQPAEEQPAEEEPAEEEPAEGEPAEGEPAAPFAEPELADGPQLVSLRNQAPAAREGYTRRVVSMRERS